MAEGDVVARLDDRVTDVVADRAIPGPEPALEPGWIVNLIPGITQRRARLKLLDAYKLTLAAP